MGLICTLVSINVRSEIKKKRRITPAKLQQTNASQLACRRLATRYGQL